MADNIKTCLSLGASASLLMVEWTMQPESMVLFWFSFYETNLENLILCKLTAISQDWLDGPTFRPQIRLVFLVNCKIIQELEG